VIVDDTGRHILTRTLDHDSPGRYVHALTYGGNLPVLEKDRAVPDEGTSRSEDVHAANDSRPGGKRYVAAGKRIGVRDGRGTKARPACRIGAGAGRSTGRGCGTSGAGHRSREHYTDKSTH
jgi:hypothetical protein